MDREQRQQMVDYLTVLFLCWRDIGYKEGIQERHESEAIADARAFIMKWLL